MILDACLNLGVVITEVVVEAGVERQVGVATAAVDIGGVVATSITAVEANSFVFVRGHVLDLSNPLQLVLHEPVVRHHHGAVEGALAISIGAVKVFTGNHIYDLGMSSSNNQAAAPLVYATSLLLILVILILNLAAILLRNRLRSRNPEGYF